MRMSWRRTSRVRWRTASIVLGLEAIVAFFFALATYGLRIVDRDLALPLGAGVVLLLLLLSWMARFRVGYALGWVAQIGLIGLGALHPFMYAVGALFAALWVYSWRSTRPTGADSESEVVDGG